MTGCPFVKQAAAQMPTAMAGRSTPTGRTECGPQMPGRATSSAAAAAETAHDAPVPLAQNTVPEASSGHDRPHTAHQSLRS